MQMPAIRTTIFRCLISNKYTIFATLLVCYVIHLHVLSQHAEERVRLSVGYETIELDAWKVRLKRKNFSGQRPTKSRPPSASEHVPPMKESPQKACPDPSPYLVGQKQPNLKTLNDDNLTELEVLVHHKDILRGGYWSPPSCKALWKIAIIIPYRERHAHLTKLLDTLIPMLQRQLLDFRFIVVEQSGRSLFNKGRIFNAAFLYASSLNVDCVVFHDVDLLPVDDRNLYYCPENPRHIAAWVDTLGYQLLYGHMFGGVAIIKMEHFKKVNGYSNSYWGWGGEDDDMGKRILCRGYLIERPDSVQGAMTMIRHVQRTAIAPKLIERLLENAALRMDTDGLSNPENWRVLQSRIFPLYHHLLVKVGEPPVEWLDCGSGSNCGELYDYDSDDGTPLQRTKTTTTTATLEANKNYDYVN